MAFLSKSYMWRIFGKQRDPETILDVTFSINKGTRRLTMATKARSAGRHVAGKPIYSKTCHGWE